MAGKLSAAFVRTVTEPGKYGDGRGLMLLVHPSGRKQFVHRITIKGKRRDLGVGAYPEVSLAEARDRADENQFLVRQGLDPTEESAGTPTFAEAAEKVIDLHSPTWTERGKSAAQWSSSLNTYATPSLGQASVDAISTADVMAALEPIWTTKRVTARRVRQRISTIMKWAIANGYRFDDPAGEALVAALPKNGARKAHHAAIPHSEVREALARIRASSGRLVTKLAFEFLVLTAVRSGEVRLARWEEIDVENGMWTVPATHTKDGKVHRIPLSTRALEILALARDHSPHSDLVFPSRAGTPLSDSTFSKMATRLGLRAVPHGFRSTFRDWCGETGVPVEVSEASLAHSLDQFGGAYARSDLFERRRVPMQAWADYLARGETAAANAE